MDDIIITGNDVALLTQLIQQIHLEFATTDISGSLSYFLGLEVLPITTSSFSAKLSMPMTSLLMHSFWNANQWPYRWLLGNKSPLLVLFPVMLLSIACWCTEILDHQQTWYHPCCKHWDLILAFSHRGALLSSQTNPAVCQGYASIWSYLKSLLFLWHYCILRCGLGWLFRDSSLH